MFCLFFAAALAATFDVDDPGSAFDDDPNDGACATAAGTCTFNAALSEADRSPGLDTITFNGLPAGTTLDVAMNSNEVAIRGRDDVTIRLSPGPFLLFDNLLYEHVTLTTGTTIRGDNTTFRHVSSDPGVRIEIEGASATLEAVSTFSTRVSGGDGHVVDGLLPGGTVTITGNGTLVRDSVGGDIGVNGDDTLFDGGVGEDFLANGDRVVVRDLTARAVTINGDDAVVGEASGPVSLDFLTLFGANATIDLESVRDAVQWSDCDGGTFGANVSTQIGPNAFGGPAQVTMGGVGCTMQSIQATAEGAIAGSGHTFGPDNVFSGDLDLDADTTTIVDNDQIGKLSTLRADNLVDGNVIGEIVSSGDRNRYTANIIGTVSIGGAGVEQVFENNLVLEEADVAGATCTYRNNEFGTPSEPADLDVDCDPGLVFGGLGTGNSAYGDVRIRGEGCVVDGNFFGVDVSGTQGTYTDVHIEGVDHVLGSANCPFPCNVFAPTADATRPDAAVHLSGRDHVFRHNGVGTDGTTAFPNTGRGLVLLDDHNGMQVLDNVIGNQAVGLFFEEERFNPGPLQVARNHIGVLPSGTAAPNGVGVDMLDDVDLSGLFTDNTIAGNTGFGLRLFHEEGSGDLDLTGNRIGVLLDDTPMGNGGDGIVLIAYEGTIGGFDPGEGNVIAHNRGAGLRIAHLPGRFPAQGIGIRGNTLFGNTNRPILLEATPQPEGSPDDTLVPNDDRDVDGGPNSLMNHPTGLSFELANGDLTVRGQLVSAPFLPYDIDVYASARCREDGRADAQQFLGTVSVSADFEGIAQWSLTVPATDTEFRTFGATATDLFQSTSELSACLDDLVVNTATEQSDADLQDGLCDVDLAADGLQCTLVAAMEEANERPGPNQIGFDLATLTIPAQNGVPAVEDDLVIDASTQPTGRVRLDFSGSAETVGFEVLDGRFELIGLDVVGANDDGVRGFTAELVRLVDVRLLDHCGWGVRTDHALELERTEVRPDPAANCAEGGVLSIESTVTGTELTVTAPGGPGIVAALAVQCTDCAVTDAQGPGVYAHEGTITLEDTLVTGSAGAGVRLANDPCDEGGSPCAEVIVRGASQIRDNADWGIRSAGDLTVDGLGTPLPIATNGIGGSCFELLSVEADPLFAFGTCVAGGVIVDGGATLTFAQLDGNAGPGAFVADSVILVGTSATDNDGTGVRSRFADVDVLPAASGGVPRFSGNAGYGLLSEGVESGVRIQTPVEVRDNGRWGIVSGPDLRITVPGDGTPVTVDGNGVGGTCLEWSTDAVPTLADPETVPCGGGGVLGFGAGVRIDNAVVSHNEGPGIVGRQGVDLVGVTVEGNGATGVYAEVGQIHFVGSAFSSAIRRNDGVGVLARSGGILAESPIAVENNGSDGVVADDGLLHLGLPLGQALPEPILVAGNGFGDSCFEVALDGDDDREPEVSSTPCNTRGIVGSAEGLDDTEIFLSNVVVRDNLGTGVRGEARVDLVGTTLTDNAVGVDTPGDLDAQLGLICRNRSTNLIVGGTVTLQGTDICDDLDLDGIPDIAEVNRDGNNDGIDDSEQPEVLTFDTPAGPLTLVAPGPIRQARLSDPELGVPFGSVTFRRDVATVETVQLLVAQDPAHTGVLLDGAPFAFDGTTGGAAIAGGFDVTVGDGLGGDLDGASNGRYVTTLGIAAEPPTDPAVTVSRGPVCGLGTGLAQDGDTEVAMLQLRAETNVATTLTSLTLVASGPADDTARIDAVSVFFDANGNGAVDPVDLLLASDVFPADDGSVTLPIAVPLTPSTPATLLVTYDLAGTADRRITPRLLQRVGLTPTPACQTSGLDGFVRLVAPSVRRSVSVTATGLTDSLGLPRVGLPQAAGPLFVAP